MKITNISMGEDYNLSPDTKIEVERTNPFFNDYGESTVPLDLPTSPRNRRMLAFPETFGGMQKIRPIDVTIQDGEFFAQCRQMVLNATHKGKISTSFYLNDGSFYSKIKDVKLKDIFKDECVPGVSTVQQAIAFCRGLRNNKDDKFSIFPLLVEDDSGQSTGFNYKILNAFGKDETIEKVIEHIPGIPTALEIPLVNVFNPDMTTPDSDFYNATKRIEYVENVSISLNEGYYITPFIRANYLLQRVFAYFGYKLLPNFFTETDPFDKMVVLNNVMDTIVKGKIRLADLVPNITCSEFIAVFRKKFCCEFTANEGKGTADVIFLRDVMASTPTTDLTHNMTEEPTIAYKTEKDYQRITLAPEDKLGSEAAESYEDFNNMAKSNPAAYFDQRDGAFYKIGFSGDFRLITKIGEGSQDYNTGEQLEPKEVKVPELIPEFRALQYKVDFKDLKKDYDIGHYLFVGKYKSLNSKMVIAGDDKDSDTEHADKEKTMLAFSAFVNGRTVGTISPYDISSPDWKKANKLFDYALYYNGDEGVFARFYKDYDLLLRNSLHDLKVKLLLSQSQKQNLPAYSKVLIRGVAFFFNKLKFVLGGKNEPMESELKTISLMEPVVVAPNIDSFFPAMNTKYKWVGRSRIVEVSGSVYDNSGPDKDRAFITMYPPMASKEYLGVEFMKQSSYRSQKVRHKSFWRSAKYKYSRTDVWLECVEKDATDVW